MPITKTVLLPVIVPNSRFCWDGHHACRHFDNGDNVPTCTLRLGRLEYNLDGSVPKGSDCAPLDEQPPTQQRPNRTLTRRRKPARNPVVAGAFVRHYGSGEVYTVNGADTTLATISDAMGQIRTLPIVELVVVPSQKVRSKMVWTVKG